MDPHETKIFTAIFIAAVILAIILVFFIITIVRHQRKNAALYELQIHAEITTLEAERKRIASDLHDDLGPILSSIKLQINSLNSVDSEDQQVIKKTSGHIDGILQKVRETSNNLMPNVLIRKGLLVAIENFADTINHTNTLHIVTHLPARVILSPDTEVHLYRIVQEIIHNAIKHAKATTLNIIIEATNKSLELKMSDNGTGFDYRHMSKQSLGFGLKNILSRVDMLNGEMYLDTKPGCGVHYTINIPIQN